MGRRIGALFVDWLIAYGLAALAMTLGWVSVQTLSTAVLVIWFVLGVLSVRLFGFTPGQFALGLIVVSVDTTARRPRSRTGARIADRLVIPPLITDTDLRGLHDRITGHRGRAALAAS